MFTNNTMNDENNKNSVISYDEFNAKAANLKTLSDVTDFVKELIAPTLQKMLEAELEGHLGYKKHDSSGRNSGNSRNGHSTKVLKTSFGQEELKIPRDRNGTFEPVAVKKYETVESDVEEKIISMYAKGMTTRDIGDHMKDIYGVDVSAPMIGDHRQDIAACPRMAISSAPCALSDRVSRRHSFQSP